MPLPGHDLAVAIAASVTASSERSVPALRRIRRAVSNELDHLPGEEVLRTAERLLSSHAPVPRWFVYEWVHHHAGALAKLDAPWLARLGRGMSSWGEVDPFACYLAGVAWREGGVSDADVRGWAASDDRWWRRAAVVSTVPLNVPARGGQGDARRTLAICDLVRTDRDEMVVKACSWALRALAGREPEAVHDYLRRRGAELAPRVVREVANKLETGRKNPPGGRAT